MVTGNKRQDQCIRIRTEEELLDFISGWDFSHWEWTVAEDDPKPDIYLVTVETIFREEPFTLVEDGEWYICPDNPPEEPWAIHRDLYWALRYITLYMVREPWGRGLLRWHSTHATREEAEEELRYLLGKDQE